MESVEKIQTIWCWHVKEEKGISNFHCVSRVWPFESELKQIGNDSFWFSLISLEKHYCKLYLSRSAFHDELFMKITSSRRAPVEKVLHCILMYMQHVLQLNLQYENLLCLDNQFIMHHAKGNDKYVFAFLEF